MTSTRHPYRDQPPRRRALCRRSQDPHFSEPDRLPRSNGQRHPQSCEPLTARLSVTNQPSSLPLSYRRPTTGIAEKSGLTTQSHTTAPADRTGHMIEASPKGPNAWHSTPFRSGSPVSLRYDKNASIILGAASAEAHPNGSVRSMSSHRTNEHLPNHQRHNHIKKLSDAVIFRCDVYHHIFSCPSKFD